MTRVREWVVFDWPPRINIYENVWNESLHLTTTTDSAHSNETCCKSSRWGRCNILLGALKQLSVTQWYGECFCALTSSVRTQKTFSMLV